MPHMPVRWETDRNPSLPGMNAARYAEIAKEAGIDFASATVAVQAIGGPSTDIAAAAASAATAAANPPSMPDS